MSKTDVSKAAIGRLPQYLTVLKALKKEGGKTVSATAIAKKLGFGEVQVRKDLCAVSGAGKPKIGYNTDELVKSIEDFLGFDNPTPAVIIGAGRLGKAILDYGGFSAYGLNITAAFDNSVCGKKVSETGKPIYPVGDLKKFCKENSVKIAVITVPADCAQEACDMAVKNNIKAIWSFAAPRLKAPDDVIIQYENMALSLAYLNKQIG